MTYSLLIQSNLTNVVMLQSQRWFSAAQLRSLLERLQLVYFPSADSRSAALALLQSDPCSPPFLVFPASDSFRFLPDSAYVSTADPVLQRIFYMLQASLSYKDRLLEKTNIGNVTASVSSNTVHYLAALQQFSDALLALSSLQSDSLRYYTRARFESELGLSWS